MGASQSTDSGVHASSPEELSRILADRFATKCFTPLELTHLKDNFFSRALDQGGIKYWNEEILSRFLGIPDGAGARAASTDGREIDAGPVIFRMVSYLGAFPFQNTLAPSVLTFEALVKVVVLLTERYGRVLRHGRKDRMKLLFGSLADVGRRDVPEKEAQKLQEQGQEQSVPETPETERGASHAAGFSIDAPANDEDEDEDEDDDDLALAALESLDAIEVFKHDHRIDRTVYEARISIDTFRRLLMLLLATASLGPRDDVSKVTAELEQNNVNALYAQVDSIIGAVVMENQDNGITYKEFSRVITNSLPYIFDPLTPLFEHLLFSENLDLSRRRGAQSSNVPEEKPAPLPSPPSSPPSPTMLAGSFESNILNTATLSHLSFFLATSSAIPNLFRNHTKLHPVFASAVHGESLTSFSHHVLTWHSPNLLLLNGTTTDSSSSKERMVTVGAYLPQPWKSSSPSSTRKSSTSNDLSAFPCLFQLSPTHTLLHGSPSSTSLKSNMPVASFSTKTGIALGCLISPSSRGSTGSEARPKPSGGGSLLIDPALENATFVVSDGLNGEGVFLPPGVSPTSTSSISSSTRNKTTEISIYNIEVWGIMPQPERSSTMGPSGSALPAQDAIAQQRAHWDFEKRDAERRKSINMKVGGGDSAEQTGRALLEMAGIIGDDRRR